MSGLRAAARCIRALRPTQLTACRAFMSTRAPDALFQTPSFPMPEDPSLWQSKYPRADPSHLWKVGSFPLQNEQEEDALACSEDLWDTPGMLSALLDNLPLRDTNDMDALLRQMDGYLADSVVKKRRKKMNKHKHRKRKKALLLTTLEFTPFGEVVEMLKKLASPKKRAHAAPSGASTGSLDAEGEGKSPEKKSKSKKPKSKPPKEKEKMKPKAKTDADLLGFGETTAETPHDEAKEADSAGVLAPEAKTPSPRKSIARAFRRKTPSDRDNLHEEKSSTKKPAASPKKMLMKLPKPKKKSKLKPEAKAHDEALDPSADSVAATEKDPLTPSKRDAAVESPKRKSRWKMPHSSKSMNNQNELIHDEKKPESSKATLSPASDNNASRENPPSPRVRDKKNKRDKRQLSAVDSSSGDSEQENQTNILSPLRRHKADPDDTLPIPESPYNPYRVQKRLTQLDVPPAYQPEVHLIGEIVSGHGFGTAGGLTCKWRVEYGSRWRHIAGDQFGQTQLDYPSTAPWTSDPDVAVWSHPIDLHFATSAFQGWPKLLLQVWRTDASMKLHVVGYGFAPVPFAAGQHKLWVSLWRPLGTTKEELDVQLLGRTPELKSDDVLFSAAWSERCRLRTVSTGKVLVHIGVLLRHFQAGVIDA